MNKIQRSVLLARAIYKTTDDGFKNKLLTNGVEFDVIKIIERNYLKCAILEINNQIHITFRGSANADNWIGTNFEFFLEEIGENTGMKVHGGFQNAVRVFLDDIYEIVKNCGKRIVFGSHSLGASVSLLTADRLYDMGIRNIYSITTPGQEFLFTSEIVCVLNQFKVSSEVVKLIKSINMGK